MIAIEQAKTSIKIKQFIWFIIMSHGKEKKYKKKKIQKKKYKKKYKKKFNKNKIISQIFF